MNQTRFFILGCQRSGTTLMRLILEAHPDVFCYDELRAYAVLQGSMVAEPPTTRWIGFKIPRWTEQLCRPVLMDAGLEGRCANFYRGEPVVFLLRDARDTIVSMLRLGSGEANWCEVWARPIIQTKLDSDENFRTRYAAELDIVRQCGERLVAIAALYWKYKTEAFLIYKQQGLPVLDVSYELLVTSPGPVIDSVCVHLGLSFHPNMLAHQQIGHTELFEGGLTVGGTDPRKSIHADSVGQWRQYLSGEDIALVERIVGDLPARVAESCWTGTNWPAWETG